MRGSHKKTITIKRANIIVPVASGKVLDYQRQEDRLRPADELHRRLRRRVPRAGQQGAPAGRHVADPRSARERRRPARRGRQRRQHLHPRRHDRLDRRAQPATPGVRRQGRRDQRPRFPSSCSSTAAPPRPPRSSPAPCRTAIAPRSSARTRTARACFRRSSRCPTAARSTSPSASTSRRAGAISAVEASVRAGAQAQRVRARQPAHRARRGADGRRANGRSRAAVSAPRSAPGAAARVAVLERRGKFLVAEPFFEPGPRLVVTRDRRADVGDLVVVNPGTARNRRGAGRATVARRLGRPDVARDVIEALMIDRGLRRGFDPAVEHEVRDSADSTPPARRCKGRAGATCARCRRSRSTRSPRATSTTRSQRRRRGRRLGAGLGPHRRRVGVRASAVAGRSRGLSARHERVRARCGRADAADRAVQRGVLARAGRGPADRHGRDGDRRRSSPFKQLLPVADPLRRAAGLRARRPDLRRQRAGIRAVGHAAGRGPRGRGCARCATGRAVGGGARVHRARVRV